MACGDDAHGCCNIPALDAELTYTEYLAQGRFGPSDAQGHLEFFKGVVRRTTSLCAAP